MSRGARHVHYDDDVVNSKKHKGSYNRRQRRRRRVGRRAKIYGAAFLLALTGFFCLVPGTSLTVVAFTNGTNSKESILRLLGPVFAGVGVTLIGISIGLVCYAVLYKRKFRTNKDRQRDAEDSGYQGSTTRDGDKLAAEVRLLDADEKDTGALTVKHNLLPNHGTQMAVHRSVGLPLVGMAASTVVVDIVHPPPSVTVSLVGHGESIDDNQDALQTPIERQFADVNENSEADSIVPGDLMTADVKQCGTTLVEI